MKQKQIQIHGYGILEYISKEVFHKQFPKEIGGYEVLGAVGVPIKEMIANAEIDGKTLSYGALSFSRIRYGIDGYVLIDGNKYIAVITSKMKRNIGIIVSAILLCGFLLFGFHSLTQGPRLDPNIGKYEAPIRLPDDFEQGRIAIPGYDDIHVKADSNTAYVALWNPDENPCYFTFGIYLEESDKLIYESGLIPPGYAVSEVKFNQSFKKGIYPITIRIDSYHLKDHQKKMNGGEVRTRIVAVKE